MSPKQQSKKSSKHLVQKAKSIKVDKLKKPMSNLNKSGASQKERSSKEEFVLGARKRKSTPSIFKIRSKKTTPIVFTMDDVQQILKEKPKSSSKEQEYTKKEFKEVGKQGIMQQKIYLEKQLPKGKKQIYGAASLSDILGFNPNDIKSKPRKPIDESQVDKKFLPYYYMLMELREQVKEGVDLHSQETLKRSSKDDSGDLSSYSYHMADAGTDTWDRDFALNLLSNEQDALFEIEEAIQRIVDGTYGVCEITGKPIAKERLKAVPFTRYSLDGQKQLEKNKNAIGRERGGVFAESSLEESAKFTNSESES